MAAEPKYVPVLKRKEGEFAALVALYADIKSSIMPLIEIPDVPYDYANDRIAKTLDEHIRGIAGRVSRCWQGNPLYVDLPWLEEGILPDGRPAISMLLADCNSLGVKATPVISTRNSEGYIDAVVRHSTTTGTGACVRLDVDDFEEDVDLEADVNRLIARFENKTNIDLLLDLKHVGEDENRTLLLTRSLLSMMPKNIDWRRLILAGASFPEDLSEIGAETIVTFPRTEWNLWKTLQRRPE